MILTVEPVLFLYMFGIFMSLSVTQEYIFNWFGREMLVRHANHTGSFNFCISTDLLNKEVNLTGGKKAGDVVQTQASLLSLATTLLGQLPSIFAALVYGPLTDRAPDNTANGYFWGSFRTPLHPHCLLPVWFVPLNLITSLAGGNRAS